MGLKSIATGVLRRRRERDTRNVSVHSRMATGGHSKKVPICKPRKEASRSLSTGTSTSDLQPPESLKDMFLMS